jgi:ribosomal subunit interface protein
MQLPLQITIKDIPHSLVLENHIQQKAKKLNTVYRRIISCRVVVDLEQKHQHQGKLFNVRIDVTVPGEEFAVTHYSNEDVYVALRDAFNGVRRRLEEFSHRQHGDGKMHHLKYPMYGKIAKLFHEGYGFIETEDGHEAYFHHSVVKPEFKKLWVGEEVYYLEEMGEKGPQASRVRLRESALH